MKPGSMQPLHRGCGCPAMAAGHMSYGPRALSCTMVLALACGLRNGLRVHFRTTLGTSVREVRIPAQPGFRPCSNSSPMLTRILAYEAGPYAAGQITHSRAPILVIMYSLRLVCALCRREKMQVGPHSSSRIPLAHDETF